MTNISKLDFIRSQYRDVSKWGYEPPERDNTIFPVKRAKLGKHIEFNELQLDTNNLDINKARCLNRILFNFIQSIEGHKGLWR